VSSGESDQTAHRLAVFTIGYEFSLSNSEIISPFHPRSLNAVRGLEVDEVETSRKNFGFDSET
jgi:hypothetical protein